MEQGAGLASIASYPHFFEDHLVVVNGSAASHDI